MQTFAGISQGESVKRQLGYRQRQFPAI